MNWVQTLSRRRIDYENPQPSQVDINDIALGISRIPRFLGQTRHAITVAQHSVAVAKIVPYVWSASEWASFGKVWQDSMQLEALCHDCVEAYTSDLPTPAKKSLGPVWRKMERRLDRCVRRALGLVGTEPWPVKLADQVSLYLEATGRNIGVRVDEWDYAFPPRVEEVVRRLPAEVKEFIATPLTEKQARRSFLSHYRRFTRDRHGW